MLLWIMDSTFNKVLGHWMDNTLDAGIMDGR